MRTNRTPMQTIRETLATELRVAKKAVEIEEILRSLTPEQRKAAIDEVKARWPEEWKPTPQRKLVGRRARR